MTRSRWRAWQAGVVDELTPLTGGGRACELVGRSRATHHRQAHPKPKMLGPYPKPRHPAELCDAERQEVLAVLNSPFHADSWMRAATGAHNARCIGSWLVLDSAGNAAARRPTRPRRCRS